MAKKESESDFRKGGWPSQGAGSADPGLSLGLSFPSFVGTLLVAKEILVGGFSDSGGSGIFVILRDSTKSSSLDLIGSILLEYSSVFW